MKKLFVVLVCLLAPAAWAIMPCYTNLQICILTPSGCPYVDEWGTNVPPSCLMPQLNCVHQGTNDYSSLLAVPIGAHCPFNGISSGPSFALEVKCPTCCKSGSSQIVGMVSWNTTKDGLPHSSPIILPAGYCGLSFIVYEIYNYPCGTIGICIMSLTHPCQGSSPPPLNLTPDVPGYVIPHWIYDSGKKPHL